MADTTLEIDGLVGGLSVRTFGITHTISQPYQARITALSANPELELEHLVGSGGVLTIRRGEPLLVSTPADFGGTLVLHGVCTCAELLHAEPAGLSTYGLVLQPRLSLLGQRINARVFQHQNAISIVRTLLEEWNIEHRFEVDESLHPVFEYRVQYGEDDLSFVHRLLETDGISYFFDHRAGSRLMLTDQPGGNKGARPPLPYIDKADAIRAVEHVSSLQIMKRVAPTRVRLRDHHFRRRDPQDHMDELRAGHGGGPAMETYQHVPGMTLTEKQQTSDTPVADDQGTARADGSYGDQLATLGLQRADSSRFTINFEATALDLWPGSVFQALGHPHPELQGDLLVTHSSFSGAHDGAWHLSGQGVRAEHPYRPPLRTAKPVVTSVQSAVVVGPAGEEIYTDEFGRVRIQLHWDRLGNKDERSSCWLRVSQGWAGAGFGMMAIPRIGQEVLVAFVGGNPDEPVIVGRLYNATHPVPHRLPEKKTVSTWRSATTPGGDGFNELSFDDMKDEELVYLHAERDLEKHVEVDERERVGHDRTVQIDHDLTHNVASVQLERTGGDRTILADSDMRRRVSGDDIQLIEKQQRVTVKGARHDVTHGAARTLVGGNAHLHAQGEYRALIDEKTSLKLAKDCHVKIGDRCATEVGNDLYLKSGGTLVLEAATRITLVGPGGFIDIGPSGVSVVGHMVRINSGGDAAEGQAAQVDDAENAAVAEVGTS